MDESSGNTSEVVEGMSNMPFSSLKIISNKTLKALAEMGFDKMTDIQAKAIPPILDEKDVVACAKTGSGKTLAFLVPAVEILHHFKIKNYQGTCVLVLSPTREIAKQTYSVAKKLMKYHSQTVVLIAGGGNLEKETDKLENGANLLIATPGRLLYHLQHTDFVHKYVIYLIIDEADRMLDFGFQEEMIALLKILPRYRQTGIYSATLSEKLSEGLLKFAVRKAAVYVGYKPNETATVAGLKQGFFEIPTEKRFLVLYTFLRKNRKVKKFIVFFSSCQSVKFHSELFNYIGLRCFSIHGKMKQNKRDTAYRQFCKAEIGILLCTDIAARGLDIPLVDNVIQYDPPADPKEYIHRVGRTARGENGKGEALIFLRPEEVHFYKYLQRSHIPLAKYNFPWGKIDPEYEDGYFQLVNGNYHFKHAAKLAYVAYIRSYRSHKLKHVFDESKLDLQAVARTFGFRRPPYVTI